MDLQIILKNPETTKIGVHIPCGYSMSINWGSNHIENKHALHQG